MLKSAKKFYQSSPYTFCSIILNGEGGGEIAKSEYHTLLEVWDSKTKDI